MSSRTRRKKASTASLLDTVHEDPTPPLKTDPPLAAGRAQSSFLDALKRNATTRAGGRKLNQRSSPSTKTNEDEEDGENETPTSRNRSASAATSSRKVKKPPSSEGTASVSANGDKKTSTRSVGRRNVVGADPERNESEGSAATRTSITKYADKNPLSASVNSRENRPVSSEECSAATRTSTTKYADKNPVSASVNSRKNKSVSTSARKAAAAAYGQPPPGMMFEPPSRDSHESERHVQVLSKSASPSKESAAMRSSTIRPSEESSFNYETPSKSVAHEQAARDREQAARDREQAAHAKADHDRAVRDQASAAGEASHSTRSATQWKVRAQIPVQDAWRSISNPNIGDPDRGQLGENGFLVVLEDPLNKLRQVWYFTKNGKKLFRADAPSFDPWSVIQGNAGVEPCLFMDAVNYEQQRLRRFYFRFSSNFVLASALGHILYDNMAFLDEFFNANGTNRFLATSTSLPDHVRVYADNEMVVDSFAVRPSNTPARYKGETQEY
jgi:hypothetical protein